MLQQHISETISISLLVLLPYLMRDYFQSVHFFRGGENGEDMLHHKNQGTDNPMFCWKFLHDSYINIKTESAHWGERYFSKVNTH